MSIVLQDFNDKNFEKEVLRSDVPVFIDFWSTYCEPCKIQVPIVTELSQEKSYEGRIKFGKFEVGDNPEIPAKIANYEYSRSGNFS